MDHRKYIGMDVNQDTISIAGYGLPRQAANGVDHRDKSGNDSAIHSGAARAWQHGFHAVGRRLQATILPLLANNVDTE
jgi:hypothetical protein